MKFITAFLILMIGGALLLWYPAAPQQSLMDQMRSNVQSWFDDKEVRLEGLQILTAADLHRMLPMDRSGAWWHLHRDEIRQTLEQQALISKAQVSPCDPISMRCFTVRIDERPPSFATSVEGQDWLIGDDGGFIAPLPREHDRSARLSANVAALVWLEGIVDRDGASQETRAKVQFVRQFIDTIEPIVNLKVAWVELRDLGETTVRFRQLKLRATFDVGSVDGLDRVIDEAKRLKLLLDEFGQRRALIGEVDLAFDKVAVVRLLPELRQAK